MSRKDSAHKFLFSLILPSKASEPHKSTLVERLGELRVARNDFLTEDESQEIRNKFLEELTTFARIPFVIRFMFIGYCIFGIFFIFYSWHLQLLGAVGVFILITAIVVLWWWRMEHVYKEKRNMSRDDRLNTVDELLGAGLISADEAARFTKNIGILFENQNNAPKL